MDAGHIHLSAPRIAVFGTTANYSLNSIVHMAVL